MGTSLELPSSYSVHRHLPLSLEVPVPQLVCQPPPATVKMSEDNLLKFFTLMDDQGGFVVKGIQVLNSTIECRDTNPPLLATPLRFCLADQSPMQSGPISI